MFLTFDPSRLYWCIFNDFLLLQDAAKQKPSSAGSTPAVSKPSSKVTPHYKMSVRPTTKFPMLSLSSPSHLRGKTRLFQGLEDSGRVRGGAASVPKETFVPRKSIKALTIAPKPSPVSWCFV